MKSITEKQKKELKKAILFLSGINDFNPGDEWGDEWFSHQLDDLDFDSESDEFLAAVFDGDGNRLGWARSDGQTTRRFDPVFGLD